MTRPGGLKRDLAAIALGHGVFALGQWAISAALAKLAGIEAMAAFGLALAVSNPIYFLAFMALRTALARDAGEGFSFSDYWRARLATLAAAAVAMAIAAATVGAARGFDGTAALLLFACIKSFDGCFDLIYGERQRTGAAIKVAISLFIRSVLGPAGCVAGLLATDGALWAGLLGWALVAAALFLLTEAPKLGAALSRAPVSAGPRAVLARSWPLGVAAALASLETAIPRYVIEWRMAPEALGYFTGVFLFFHAAIIVANAFGSAATPYLGRAHAAGDAPRFWRILRGLLALAACLGAAGVLAALWLGEWALGLLYTEAYAAYADVLTLMMAAVAFRFVASFLQFALVAAGRYRAHMQAHAGLAVVAAAASLALVPEYGLHGAAYATIIVAAAQAALIGFLASRIEFRPRADGSPAG